MTTLAGGVGDAETGGVEKVDDELVIWEEYGLGGSRPAESSAMSSGG